MGRCGANLDFGCGFLYRFCYYGSGDGGSYCGGNGCGCCGDDGDDFASKPLTAFVDKHPTVVMLCLGFLLMIGFSLIAEAFHFHIPKGYLYAAIGFSILIELFNQVSQRMPAK